VCANFLNIWGVAIEIWGVEIVNGNYFGRYCWSALVSAAADGSHANSAKVANAKMTTVQL
jgi:hypothetical protein